MIKKEKRCPHCGALSQTPKPGGLAKKAKQPKVLKQTKTLVVTGRHPVIEVSIKFAQG